MKGFRASVLAGRRAMRCARSVECLAGLAILVLVSTACSEPREAAPEVVLETHIDEIEALVPEEDPVLARPYDIDLDAQGRIFVLDRQDQHINVFDRGGGLQFTIGGTGEGPGEFGSPREVGISGRTLRVFDPQRGAIHEYDVDGEYLGQQRYDGPGFSASVAFGAERFAYTSATLPVQGALAVVTEYGQAEGQRIGEPVTPDAYTGAPFLDVVHQRVFPVFMRAAGADFLYKTRIM